MPTIPKTVSRYPNKEIRVKESIDTGDKLPSRFSLNLGALFEMLPHLMDYDGQIELHFPVFPYQREDKAYKEFEGTANEIVHNPLKNFCKLLDNSLPYTNFVTYDLHSDVPKFYLPRLKNITQSEIWGDILYPQLAQKLFAEDNVGASRPVIVAPDAGAIKKVEALSDKLAKKSIPLIKEGYIQGLKVRDPSTGALSGFKAYGDIAGNDCLIFDDLCDGGGTFLGLAKELRDQGARDLHLVVTHGYFSKGLEDLASVFKTIHTTDTVTTMKTVERKGLYVYPLLEGQDFYTKWD